MRSLRRRGNPRCSLLQARTPEVVLIALIVLGFCAVTVLADEGYRITELEIFVYKDGVAHVRSTLAVNSTVSAISLPIVREVANVLVTDENRRLIRYDLTNDTVLIYTFGASGVELEYDTTVLTHKDGPVWTLKLSLPVQARVHLPEGAAVIYLSGKPTSIEAKEDKPILNLDRGSWEISYVLPLQTTQTTLVTTKQTIPLPSVSTPSLITVGAMCIVIVVLLVGLIVALRHRRVSPEMLSPADNQMLQAIRSKGGKIFESELRDSLGLPKTSAWRRVKKLEKRGLVKIRRVGSQNEIESS
jgi:uncharacterized membrane protein